MAGSPMEEYAHEDCRVVYFCTATQDEIYELYHKRSPPAAASKDSPDRRSLIHWNVCALLDDDQGGFSEVFVCSRAEDCMQRLEGFANTSPTLVIIELGHKAEETKQADGAFAFLRRLASDIQGARFQKHVLPFVLLIEDDAASPGKALDPHLTTSCLQNGALDILRDPLRHEDINRVIGHFKDTVRTPARLIGAPMAQNLVDSIRDTSKPPKIASHRPDEILSAERKAAVEGAIWKWHFPAQDFNMDELTYGVMIMLEHLLTVPGLETYSLPRPQLMTYVLTTRRQYKHENEVHYHNWRHAVDVAQSIYCFLLDIRLCPPLPQDDRKLKEPNALESILTPVDALILLVSAIGHDVGHPGVNNAFLVACNHPLAQTYNDKSVLENYHCAAYTQILRRHWPALSHITGFRATMISTILATDMGRHFEYMASLGDLKTKVESNEPSVGEWGEKEREHARELIMALLMKAADISNVARPFPVSSKWAKILMNEFARQGELENELEIPTCLFGGPPNTEDILAAAKSQKGFMDLFGFPLFRGISEVMPSLSGTVHELERNKAIWDQKIEEETARRERDSSPNPPEREHAHLDSVTQDDIEETAQGMRHSSEPSAVPSRQSQTPSTPVKRAPIPGMQPSPTEHAAHDLRQQLVQGIAMEENKRSSSPFLGSPMLPLSPSSPSSRRSSRDVALDQLQHMNNFAPAVVNSGSRRGSADASWQIHQSYPGSRRGSKDESLTTIVFTPNRRSSPASPGKKTSPGKPIGKRGSLQGAQKQVAARSSGQSPRSQTTSSGTATTTQYSPSTQPSTEPSLARDDELLPPAALSSIPSTEDPFMSPENWPDGAGGHRESDQVGLPGALPATPPLSVTKSDSSQVVSRMTSGELESDGRSTPRKVEHGIRESRSRSRLRGLKFWKKKKDVTGPESPDSP